MGNWALKVPEALRRIFHAKKEKAWFARQGMYLKKKVVIKMKKPSKPETAVLEKAYIRKTLKALDKNGVPTGSRTPVTGVKGRKISLSPVLSHFIPALPNHLLS